MEPSRRRDSMSRGFVRLLLTAALAALAPGEVLCTPSGAASGESPGIDAGQVTNTGVRVADGVGLKLTGTVSRPIRIVLTGDSMTAAGDDPSPGARSYRRRLHRLLTGAGIAVDFLGFNGDGSADDGAGRHDAWGGAWIGPGGSANNIFDRMPAVLAPAVNPDVVIMALGWNSAIGEPGVAGAKYEALVARVAGLVPRAQLVLATLSPFRGATDAQTAAYWPGYRGLNRSARQMAAASSTDRLHLADLAAGSFAREDYDDDIHWNEAGADKAARIIFDTIVNRVLPLLP